MVPTRSLMNLHHVARMRHEPHAAAAALRSSRSRTIGYLIDRGAEPEFMSDVDLFRNRVWRGITDMAEAQAYFFLQAGYVDAKRCRALLSSGRVDGLVVDVMVPDEVLAELVSALSGPVVVIGRSTEVPAWRGSRQTRKPGQKRLRVT